MCVCVWVCVCVCMFCMLFSICNWSLFSLNAEMYNDKHQGLFDASLFCEFFALTPFAHLHHFLKIHAPLFSVERLWLISFLHLFVFFGNIFLFTPFLFTHSFSRTQKWTYV